MKKMHLLLVVFLAMLTLGVAIIAGANAAADDQERHWITKMSKAQKEAKTVENPDEIVAKINGRPITKKFYESCKAFMEAANEREGKSAPKKADIIKVIAKQIIIVQEAERRGISVSEQEIDQEIEKQRQAFGDAPFEGQQDLRVYCEAQGMALDEYWTSNSKRDSTRFILLTRKFTAEALSQAKTDDDIHKVHKDAADNLEVLYEQAKIEY